jgi:choice-of-anchor B domain-containing protein
MKQLLSIAALFFLALHGAEAQVSQGMTLLSRWDDESLPLADPGRLRLQYSGCWGLALKGREYAVLGGASHILFFDVTDPVKPKLIRKYPSPFNTVWREFKSYKDRIYAVSDATSEGLLVFDMRSAPDTVLTTYASNEFFTNSHSITLDTVSGRIYLNGTSRASMMVLDVKTNPDKPTLLASVSLPGGYIHDSYVRGDTLYASSGYNGLFVYDFKNPTQPKVLASIRTAGYNHNSWLTTDGRYAYYTEEIPAGQPIRVLDLQQLAKGEIEVRASFLDPLTPRDTTRNAIPHNVYIKGNLLFNSQYEDGLLVYDISRPLAPRLIGWYDTYPQNNRYNGYFGNWGNYPWLPSGNIIAGDMQNGLYMLRLNGDVLSTEVPDGTVPALQLSPNPARDWIDFAITGTDGGENSVYEVWNMTGQMIRRGIFTAGATTRIALAGQSAGMYYVKVWVKGQKNTISRKFILR